MARHAKDHSRVYIKPIQHMETHPETIYDQKPANFICFFLFPMSIEMTKVHFQQPKKGPAKATLTQKDLTRRMVSAHCPTG